MKLNPLIFAAAAAFTTHAHSAITYVDANTSTNTALVGGGTIVTGTDIAQTADGNWSTRPRTLVNGGTVLVAMGNESVTPLLVTTITLPSAGIYNIYGYFYINNNGVSIPGDSGNWDAAFRLGSGGIMTTYRANNATNIAGVTVGAHFTNTSPVVIVEDGGQDLFQASLGTWDTAINGLTLTVFIDDPETTSITGASDDRTWYDGIGYEAIPEPSSALLGSLGLLALLRRRR